MTRTLYTLPQLCTGCNRCAMACSATKTGAFQPSAAFLYINQFTLDGASVPSICFHCPNAACLKACEEGAIYRDADDTVVVISEKCTACGDCVEACPYGMIRLNGPTAQKCDLCQGSPHCVDWCEPGALVFTESVKALVKERGLQMKQRSEDGPPETRRRRLAQAVFNRIRP